MGFEGLGVWGFLVVYGLGFSFGVPGLGLRVWGVLRCRVLGFGGALMIKWGVGASSTIPI